MKCIDKIKKNTTILLLLVFIVSLGSGCSKEEELTMSDYEEQNYNVGLTDLSFFSNELSVSATDTSSVEYTAPESVYGAGLFGVSDGTMYYGHNLFEKLYPASTTKIVTAYVALKYGNLDDVITITEEDVDLPWDSSVCGLEAGDTLTLYDLLTGLLLKSGNDNAMAIARHISGDPSSFAQLMTEEVKKIGATGSNFVNPHGLHDDNHYTSVYDLYLIFNECIKNPTFVEIISYTSYNTVIVDSAGTEEAVTWHPTNAYAVGGHEVPSNVVLVGGKTGYTDSARSCLVLLEKDAADNQYISIVLGAETKDILYDQMTLMIESLPTL